MNTFANLVKSEEAMVKATMTTLLNTALVLIFVLLLLLGLCMGMVLSGG